MKANKTVTENWKYHNPVEIIFGVGQVSKLSLSVGNLKAVLITTPGFTKRGTVDYLRKLLGKSLVAVFDRVRINPTFYSIKTAFNDLCAFKYDLIVVLGGGSSIDTAKAVAAMNSSGREGWLEDHVKHGAPFPERFHPKPIIAIPTTAGTGSEVTMWATVWDMEEKKKHSISHYFLYPQKAILDPELTLSLPERETIYSGLDALSHAMEAVWNKNHNPISDTFALQAISLVYDHLPFLKNDLANLDSRTSLLHASLMAGLAFSNTKTALAHSISYPLTAHFGLPHGLASALPLRQLLLYNGKHNFERVKIIARSLKAETELNIMEARIRDLFRRLGISLSLSDYGVGKDELSLIMESAITSERSGNNIVNANSSDFTKLLERLF